MFCPKCGSILVPGKEGDKTVLSCSCGYKSEDKEAGKLKETVKGKDIKVDVVDSEESLKAMPKMKAECPKCHNLVCGDCPKVAWVIEYNCPECGYHWTED